MMRLRKRQKGNFLCSNENIAFLRSENGAFQP